MSRRGLMAAVAMVALVAMACAAVLVMRAGRVPSAAPVPSDPSVPLLWKVSDGDNALYLLGSFHLLRESDYPLSAEVDAAFVDAETLLFELSPEELESPELGQQMLQAARWAEGRRLDDALGPVLSARLQEWLGRNRQALGPAASEIQAYEPWFVAMLVSLTELGRHGLDPALGLDRRLGQRAIEAGKPVAGLETGAQQVAFLDGLAADDQRQMLEEALDEAGDPSRIDALHAAWRRGDVAVLQTEMGEGMRRDHPDLYRRINVERNLAWLPVLEARLGAAAGTDDTLVVVGALHLLGEDGLVEALRARGYAVERLCTACGKTAGLQR